MILNNIFLKSDFLYYYSLEGILKVKYEAIKKKKKKNQFLTYFFVKYHMKEINFLKIFSSIPFLFVV